MATLISNGRIFDGVSVISECGHVLIESGRISKISSQQPLSPPADCVVVDATGCTLLPGLIDAHVHVFRDVQLLETAIQYGVTTVLDMHNEREWFKEINVITRQRNDVSDVKSCCYGATIKNGWPSAIVRLVSQEENVRVARNFVWICLSDFSFSWRIASLSGPILQTGIRSKTALLRTKLPGLRRRLHFHNRRLGRSLT
jgi:hypothetical protein